MGGTCFWEAIIKRLDVRDLREFLPNQRGISPSMFVVRLKSLNLKTNNVLWNGEELIEKQLEENFNHVKNFNVRTINDGYFCSTFDPFLFLVTELFKIEIINNYNNNKIVYLNKEKKRYTIVLHNDKGHMW